MYLEILPQSVLPTNLAVSAARTCYSAKGLVRPENSASWGKKDELLKSIYDAGHHTTLQHSHITLLLDGLSRHLIWRLLHSHQFYNSEQVSQRYAKMHKDAFVYPASADMQKWSEFYSNIFAYYEELSDMLVPIMQKILPKFKAKDAVKKAQEFARYVLPQGMGAYMYHTVNIITALRYISVAKSLPEAKSEAILFAQKLADKLLALDPSLAPLIHEAQNATAVFENSDIKAIKTNYGVKSNDFVKILDAMPNLGMGALSNYAEVLRPFTVFPDTSVTCGFNSYIKLSLSADAQNQRHRASLAHRPSLKSIYEPKWYTPRVIEENADVLKKYDEAMILSYGFFESEAPSLGFGEAVYALPNSHLTEIIEFDDYARFAHKSQMRLCYNAQQEIFDITYEQIRQLKMRGLDATYYLPPCCIRNTTNLHPICPEGIRYCGEKVWKKEFNDFIRKI